MEGCCYNLLHGSGRQQLGTKMALMFFYLLVSAFSIYIGGSQFIEISKLENVNYTFMIIILVHNLSIDFVKVFYKNAIIEAKYEYNGIQAVSTKYIQSEAK